MIALSDDLAVTISDPDSEDEERFVSLGMDPNGRVLVTVFTRRWDGFGSSNREKHRRASVDSSQLDEAGGSNYQTLIKKALRGYMEQTREPLEETLRRVVREELRHAS